MIKKILLLVLYYIISSSNIFCDNLFVTDIKNNIINLLDDSSEVFIIFIDSYCCHNCYNLLYQSILEYNDSANISIVYKTKNTVYAKRTAIDDIRNYINCKKIYFDNTNNLSINVNQSISKSIYTTYKIDYMNTPILLYISKNKKIRILINYDELYNKSSHSKKSIKKVIENKLIK